MNTSADGLRILIACEHASARFGGEAALPLHYFRVLRARGADVWLLAHARTRDELERLFPGETRMRFIEDTGLARAMWRLGQRLPAQIAYFTTGFVSRLATQLAQRRVVRQLVREAAIDVIHQPMPVSPREPSLLFGFGVPVVIGPMNGGMDYPPAFARQRGVAERMLLALGRLSASMLNLLMPGKRRAEMLLVANPRTRDALPAGVSPRVLEIVENGVDLSLWQAGPEVHDGRDARGDTLPTYAFVGRLVDWKAVDLLLRAFQRASRDTPMALVVVGDGPERPALERLAAELGIAAPLDGAPGVRFAGWLPQAECAQRLQGADALVLPSLLECGGAVVLEAMAMGKPVIATAWGGPLDYLDERCGVLVPPASRDALVQGLADAMLRLAASPELRREMGRHGREKVRRDYDWEVKVDRMVAVYRHAVQRGVPGRASLPAGVS
jgi:glycosyltransferase involved in cell wall biosynthesis